jgi:hypothetical protein
MKSGSSNVSTAYLAGIRSRDELKTSRLGPSRDHATVVCETFHTVSEDEFSDQERLGLELLRAERLPQLLPGGPNELGAPDDLLYLRAGAVAEHVLFLEHLLEGRALVSAADDVAEDLLLALGERGGFPAAQEPLPQRPSLGYVGLAPSSSFFHHQRARCYLPKLRAAPKGLFHRNAWKVGISEVRIHRFTYSYIRPE